MSAQFDNQDLHDAADTYLDATYPEYFDKTNKANSVPRSLFQEGAMFGAEHERKSSGHGDLRVAIAVYQADGKLYYQNAFLTVPKADPGLTLARASDADLWAELMKRREQEEKFAASGSGEERIRALARGREALGGDDDA